VAEDVGGEFPEPEDRRLWKAGENRGGGGGDGAPGGGGAEADGASSGGEGPDEESEGAPGGRFPPPALSDGTRRGVALHGAGEESEDGRGLRYRHDGFTPERQRAFLSALEQTGCVDDACRVAGISDTTAYRTREKLPDFARSWNAALARAAMPLRALAWERATQGAETKVIRDGKHVESRFKPSDSILRLLMQGSDPDAYGRPFGGAGGGLGKIRLDQLDKQSRKQLLKEAEAEITARINGKDKEDLAAKIMKMVAAVKKRQREQGGHEGGGGV